MQFLKALASVITSELVPVLSRTASAVSAAFDISAYEDLVEIQLHAGAATAGTTPTLDVKVTHCVASDGVYADVSNAAFTRVTTVAGVQTLVLNKNALHRYLEISWTIGGTNGPAFPFGVSFKGFKKYSS